MTRHSGKQAGALERCRHSQRINRREIEVGRECGVEHGLVTQSRVDIRQQRESIKSFPIELIPRVLEGGVNPIEGCTDRIVFEAAKWIIIQEMQAGLLIINRCVIETSAVSPDQNQAAIVGQFLLSHQGEAPTGLTRIRVNGLAVLCAIGVPEQEFGKAGLVREWINLHTELYPFVELARAYITPVTGIAFPVVNTLTYLKSVSQIPGNYDPNA